MPAPLASERTLIVTADDFGLHARVNEAVERAHLNGILTTASLMVPPTMPLLRLLYISRRCVESLFVRV